MFESFLADDTDHALQHGPTYMGNALACAAADASLDLFERSDFEPRVRHLERTLREGLEPLRARPGVRDVRCKGAIGVVEMGPGTASRSESFATRGAFLRPLRLRSCDVVYLMPPLIIEQGDLDVLFEALDGALARP